MPLFQAAKLSIVTLSLITNRVVWSLINLNSCWYPFLQHIFYKPNFFVGPIHVLYFIYSFKHGSSSCNLLGKLRECGLESMGRFLSDLLLKPCPLTQPMCATKWARNISSTPSSWMRSCTWNLPQNSFYALVDCYPKFLP